MDKTDCEEKNEEENVDIVVRNLLEIYPPLMRKINTCDFMKDLNITPNLCRILFILKYQGEMTLSQLSKRMVMNRSNCSRAVDELYELEYVDRKTDPEDRRRILLTLSTEGKKAVEKLQYKIREEIKSHLSELPDRDIKKLRSASEEIHEILSKLN